MTPLGLGAGTVGWAACGVTSSATIVTGWSQCGQARMAPGASAGGRAERLAVWVVGRGSRRRQAVCRQVAEQERRRGCRRVRTKAVWQTGQMPLLTGVGGVVGSAGPVVHPCLEGLGAGVVG